MQFVLPSVPLRLTRYLNRTLDPLKVSLFSNLNAALSQRLRFHVKALDLYLRDNLVNVMLRHLNRVKRRALLYLNKHEFAHLDSLYPHLDALSLGVQNNPQWHLLHASHQIGCDEFLGLSRWNRQKMWLSHQNNLTNPALSQLNTSLNHYIPCHLQ